MDVGDGREPIRQQRHVDVPAGKGKVADTSGRKLDLSNCFSCVIPFWNEPRQRFGSSVR